VAYAVSVVCNCPVGPDAVVIKLVDRETLMKEREERLKVLLSFVKLLKCYSYLLRSF